MRRRRRRESLWPWFCRLTFPPALALLDSSQSGEFLGTRRLTVTPSSRVHAHKSKQQVPDLANDCRNPVWQCAFLADHVTQPEGMRRCVRWTCWGSTMRHRGTDGPSQGPKQHGTEGERQATREPERLKTREGRTIKVEKKKRGKGVEGCN